jgi:hypothetical protein
VAEMMQPVETRLNSIPKMPRLPTDDWETFFDNDDQLPMASLKHTHLNSR